MASYSSMASLSPAYNGSFYTQQDRSRMLRLSNEPTSSVQPQEQMIHSHAGMMLPQQHAPALNDGCFATMAPPPVIYYPFAFFSTNGGRTPARSLPNPKPPQIARSNARRDMHQMITLFRACWPHECFGIFARSSVGHEKWDVTWFFDEFDFHVLGGEFCYNLILQMQKENEAQVVRVVREWSALHKKNFPWIPNLYLGLEAVFADRDREIYGDEFLKQCLQMIRYNVETAQAKEYAKAAQQTLKDQPVMLQPYDQIHYQPDSWSSPTMMMPPKPKACTSERFGAYPPCAVMPTLEEVPGGTTSIPLSHQADENQSFTDRGGKRGRGSNRRGRSRGAHSGAAQRSSPLNHSHSSEDQQSLQDVPQQAVTLPTQAGREVQPLEKTLPAHADHPRNSRKAKRSDRSYGATAVVYSPQDARSCMNPHPSTPKPIPSRANDTPAQSFKEETPIASSKKMKSPKKRTSRERLPQVQPTWASVVTSRIAGRKTGSPKKTSPRAVSDSWMLKHPEAIADSSMETEESLLEDICEKPERAKSEEILRPCEVPEPAQEPAVEEETTLKMLPELETAPEPEPEPGREQMPPPAPEPEMAPMLETEPEPEINPESETVADAGMEPAHELTPSSDVQPKPETESETENEQEVETESETERGSEQGSETKSESEPKSQQESERDLEPDTEPQPESEPEPEIESESEPDPEPEPEPEPEAKTQPDIEPELEYEQAPEVEIDPAQELKTERAQEPETEPEPNRGTEHVIEPEPEPQPELDPFSEMQLHEHDKYQAVDSAILCPTDDLEYDGNIASSESHQNTLQLSPSPRSKTVVEPISPLDISANFEHSLLESQAEEKQSRTPAELHAILSPESSPQFIRDLSQADRQLKPTTTCSSSSTDVSSPTKADSESSQKKRRRRRSRNKSVVSAATGNTAAANLSSTQGTAVPQLPHSPSQSKKQTQAKGSPNSSPRSTSPSSNQGSTIGRSPDPNDLVLWSQEYSDTLNLIADIIGHTRTVAYSKELETIKSQLEHLDVRFSQTYQKYLWGSKNTKKAARKSLLQIAGSQTEKFEELILLQARVKSQHQTSTPDSKKYPVLHKSTASVDIGTIATSQTARKLHTKPSILTKAQDFHHVASSKFLDLSTNGNVLLLFETNKENGPQDGCTTTADTSPTIVGDTSDLELAVLPRGSPVASPVRSPPRSYAEVLGAPPTAHSPLPPTSFKKQERPAKPNRSNSTPANHPVPDSQHSKRRKAGSEEWQVGPEGVWGKSGLAIKGY